jgi:glutathione S-transferase
MKLYYHPLSSYSQKVLMAFHEKGVTFTPEIVDLMIPERRAAYKKVYPLTKVPLLMRDDGGAVPESSIIIEYIDAHFSSGTRLIPEDKELALRCRFHDRQFDLYVNEPLQKIFFDGLRPESERDPKGVAAAKERLDIMYTYFDGHFAKNTWAVGDSFSMADCAAAPCLTYLRMTYPFQAYPHLTAYWARLAERSSFQKVQAEAEPYLAQMMARLQAAPTP